MNSSPAGLPVDLSAPPPAEREQLQAILVKAKQTKQASVMPGDDQQIGLRLRLATRPYAVRCSRSRSSA
jgi:hypothetical protein